MGYDLIPRNKAAGDFYMGAFSFPTMLQACSYLWPVAFGKAEFYAINEAPRRGNKPLECLMSNDGYYVTAEEAKIMARLVKNFVRVQRCALDEQTEDATSRERPSTGDVPEWPLVVGRADFLDKFDKFADWVVKSKGFWIH